MNTLEKIVFDTGMSTRPEYYSGYGANERDVGAHRLKTIHDKIKEHYGAEAAAGYVKMVRKLETLAATVFLQALYRLQQDGWTVSEQSDPPRVTVEPRGKTTDEMGFVLMAGLFTQQHCDPVSDQRITASMRNQFMRSIGEPAVFNRYDIERILQDYHRENMLREMDMDALRRHGSKR